MTMRSSVAPAMLAASALLLGSAALPAAATVPTVTAADTSAFSQDVAAAGTSGHLYVGDTTVKAYPGEETTVNFVAMLVDIESGETIETSKATFGSRNDSPLGVKVRPLTDEEMPDAKAGYLYATSELTIPEDTKHGDYNYTVTAELENTATGAKTNTEITMTVRVTTKEEAAKGSPSLALSTNAVTVAPAAKSTIGFTAGYGDLARGKPQNDVKATVTARASDDAPIKLDVESRGCPNCDCGVIHGVVTVTANEDAAPGDYPITIVGSYELPNDGGTVVKEEQVVVTVSGDDAPGDDNPGDDAPGDDNPGDDAPGDDEPGADPSGESRLWGMRGPVRLATGGERTVNFRTLYANFADRKYIDGVTTSFAVKADAPLTAEVSEQAPSRGRQTPGLAQGALTIKAANDAEVGDYTVTLLTNNTEPGVTGPIVTEHPVKVQVTDQRRPGRPSHPRWPHAAAAELAASQR